MPFLRKFGQNYPQICTATYIFTRPLLDYAAGRIGQLGTLNMTYLSLASSSLWLVSMSCCLMAASSRLMAKVVSSTSARFTWPCTKEKWKSGKEHVVFALPIFLCDVSSSWKATNIIRKTPTPMYSISAGRHWKVGECSRRMTATSYLV